MGQSDVNKSLVRFNVEETGYIELLPLEDIIYLAQENSPLLKSTDYSLLNIDAEIKLIKQKWTEYLSLSGSYIYGTSSYLDQSETVFEVDYSTLNRKSIFYHVGVSVRIPLSVITNQKHKVMIAENDKRINLLQKDDALMKLRQSVISYYTTFNNRMRVLKVKNDKLQSLELASQYAEKALKAGQLEILEYSRIATERAQANEEIENVRSEASLAFLILSDLTGESIRI
jgi:outer membrane protein TolC